MITRIEKICWFLLNFIFNSILALILLGIVKTLLMFINDAKTLEQQLLYSIILIISIASLKIKFSIH